MKADKKLRIFNIMMCRKLGGIQQAFLDYSEALSAQGHDVINITSRRAKINLSLDQPIELPNLASFCPISILYLRLLIERRKPDMVIIHGGRAATFALALKKAGVPVIGVTHNYSVKRIKKCDFVLCITEDLKNHMIKGGFPADHLFKIPNMVRVSEIYKVPQLRAGETVIGAYGRFVHKKGFQDLILALKIIVDQGHKVRLLLGGTGKEEEGLKKLVRKNDLADYVEFSGWVKGQKEFFSKIDIFCIPSLHEPFGIVILEGILHSKPIIATKSEGAMEILQHEKTALLANKGDPQDIADKLIEMMNDKRRACDLSEAAYSELVDHYSVDVVGRKLSETLRNIIG